jgi:hypothetical protein
MAGHHNGAAFEGARAGVGETLDGVGVKLGQPATSEGRLGGGAEAQKEPIQIYAYYGRITPVD